MEIDVILTATHACPEAVAGKTAVVIDVLRATSTIVTAMANGCQAIIPSSSIDEALNLVRNNKAAAFVLGGEGHCKVPLGFQLGNSPYEYTPRKVQGKNIIFSTTNGTKAIKNSASAGNLIIGSLLNAKFVAKRAFDLGKNIVLVCAGTRGKFSLEDTFTAGLITGLIYQKKCQIQLTDTAKTAYRLYLKYRHTLIYPLQNSINGRNLIRLGFGRDLQHCAKLNKYDLVPSYREGKITL